MTPSEQRLLTSIAAAVTSIAHIVGTEEAGSAVAEALGAVQAEQAAAPTVAAALIAVTTAAAAPEAPNAAP